jgi:hypothetical protein
MFNYENLRRDFHENKSKLDSFRIVAEDYKRLNEAL